MTKTAKATKATKTKTTKKAAPSTPAPSIRIVERPSHFKGVERLVFAEASSLSDNPKNWKTHTKRQTEALDAEFETVGWAGAELYNLSTGRLIDGHGRQRTQHVRKTGVVPVLLGRWTEKEEEQILLHLDPIGAMFETDRARYDALMQGHQKALEEFTDNITAESKTALEDLNKSLDLQIRAQDYGAPASFLPPHDLETVAENEQKEAAKSVVDIDSLPRDIPGLAGLKLWGEMPFDCFGTSGILGIPSILPDLIADPAELFGTHGSASITPWVGPETPQAPAYFFIYGCAAVEKVRSNRMVVAFYTWDQKFESVWNDPRPFTARMLACQVFAAISPNYSCWSGSPEAYQAYQVYRSRWLSRYWQAAGIKVIPDLQPPTESTGQLRTILLAGIPREAACVAVQLVTRGEKEDDAYFAHKRVSLMSALEELRPRSLLAYRSSKTPKDFFRKVPGNIPVYEVDTWMGARKKALAAHNASTDQTYLSTGVT